VDIELTQVVPPYLHLLLGIVQRHHSLLEKESDELDREVAEKLSKGHSQPQEEEENTAFKNYIRSLRSKKR
jgi:hypothetical protein